MPPAPIDSTPEYRSGRMSVSEAMRDPCAPRARGPVAGTSRPKTFVTLPGYRGCVLRGALLLAVVAALACAGGASAVLLARPSAPAAGTTTGTTATITSTSTTTTVSTAP